MTTKTINFNDLDALRVVKTLQQAGFQAYFVGGAVRDALLGVPAKDVDIATNATPDKVQSLFEKSIPIGIDFGIVAVVLSKNKPIEVATFRLDGKYSDHRRPDQVTFGSALEDAKRRDFTINGLFYDPISNELIDHVEGEKDIEGKTLRAIGNPQIRFEEDALRIMRGIRFSTKYDLDIESKTFAEMKNHSSLLREISVERIQEELLKTFTSKNPMRALELCDEIGILKNLLPEFLPMKGCTQGAEFHPEGDVWQHTLEVLRHIKDENPVVALGALFHDISKPETRRESEGKISFHSHDHVGEKKTREILKRFKFSNELMDGVSQMVRDHLKFFEVKNMRQSTLRKFLGDHQFPNLLKVHYYDCMGGSKNLEAYHYCQEKLEEYKNEPILPKPLISGSDLIDLGLKPGPKFKKILDKIYSLQLENQFHEKKDALEEVKKMK